MGVKTVYCFYFYDRRTGCKMHSPRAATIATIEKLDGVPLKETALEISESEVDAHGFLMGPANCEDPSHTGRQAGAA